MSPYCLKVESYLRLRRLDYRVEIGDLRSAPRGQLPWVAVDGREIGDSTRILDYLEARSPDPLDAGLSATERALGWSVQRTLEESTVWALRYQRFVEPVAWRDTKLVVQQILPAALRPFLPALIRRQMQQALRAQGAGRHDAQGIYDLARRDFDAAASALGDKPFLAGGRVRSFDLSLFGFVASFSCATARSPVTEHLLELDNLLAHHERMRQLCFPEMPSWVASRLAASTGRDAARAAVNQFAGAQASLN
jgi:glutathione S-transferase